MSVGAQYKNIFGRSYRSNDQEDSCSVKGCEISAGIRVLVGDRVSIRLGDRVELFLFVGNTSLTTTAKL